MNTYRIGTVVSLAIALIAYPGGNLFAARKHAPAPQAQGNTKPNPQDPGGHSAKGVEFAKKKEYDKAIQISPNDASARRFRGFVYISKSEWQKAIDDYTVVVQRVPDDGGAW